MQLTRNGIVDAFPGSVTPERPENAAELLAYWHETLETLDDDYLLGDLIALLRNVEDIARLSPLLACDVAATLADADRPPDDYDPLQVRYVRVRNVVELQTYEQDPTQPD